MIDNFDIIKNFIENNVTMEYGDFLFVQILKRRKENPELKKDVNLIDTFFFIDIRDFDDYKEQIVNLCHEHNARAYIRLNKRNADKISLQALKISTDELISSIHEKYEEPLKVYCEKNYINMDNITDTTKKFLIIRMISDILVDGDWFDSSVRYQFLSAAGQFASDPVKKWIIDVDDNLILDEVKSYLETITKVLMVIPTKNGIHIITTGFNPNLFINKFPNVEIKKDSPTVLYSI